MVSALFESTELFFSIPKFTEDTGNVGKVTAITDCGS